MNSMKVWQYILVEGVKHFWKPAEEKCHSTSRTVTLVDLVVSDGRVDIMVMSL